MITLTRGLARQLHDVFRRGLAKHSDGSRPAVVLETGPTGLTIRSWSEEAAIELRLFGQMPQAQVRLPAETFRLCAGPHSQPLTIDTAENDQLIVRWTDKSIPQTVAFDQPESHGEFPPMPEVLKEPGPGFLYSLRQAIETSAVEASKGSIFGEAHSPRSLQSAASMRETHRRLGGPVLQTDQPEASPRIQGPSRVAAG